MLKYLWAGIGLVVTSCSGIYLFTLMDKPIWAIVLFLIGIIVLVYGITVARWPEQE